VFTHKALIIAERFVFSCAVGLRLLEGVANPIRAHLAKPHASAATAAAVSRVNAKI
jgi:hypothetical protein